MHNTEFRFCLALPHERPVIFTEPLTYQWIDVPEAAALFYFCINPQRYEDTVINFACQAALFISKSAW